MKDLTGMKFGRLFVDSLDVEAYNSGVRKKAMWRCVCDCGNVVTVRGSSLTGGISKSCGCLQKEGMSQRASKHHGFGTRLYNIWNSMRQRCNNPNNHAYHNYGGRGIKICPEWDDFAVFREWAISAGYDESAPRGQCTIERINVNGDYSPENCKWATMMEQSKNKRNNVFLEYNGVVRSLKSWEKDHSEFARLALENGMVRANT